jgi:hypothetical protein
MNTHVPVPEDSKQVPMNPSMHRVALARAPHQSRSLEMLLMPEALARAQMRGRLREAESQRTARGIVRARKLQARAERVSLKARRALAVAVMQ